VVVVLVLVESVVVRGEGGEVIEVATVIVSIKLSLLMPLLSFDKSALVVVVVAVGKLAPVTEVVLGARSVAFFSSESKVSYVELSSTVDASDDSIEVIS
jgi:hypothetical protein